MGATQYWSLWWCWFIGAGLRAGASATGHGGMKVAVTTAPGATVLITGLRLRGVIARKA
jgi:hypothetical protein